MRISDWSSDVCFSDLADALVEREITADPLDAGEHARPVADQRRALDRRAQLAVLDPVRLGARKHELARDDIDLPAACCRVLPVLSWVSCSALLLRARSHGPRRPRRAGERRGGKAGVRTCRSRW